MHFLIREKRKLVLFSLWGLAVAGFWGVCYVSEDRFAHLRGFPREFLDLQGFDRETGPRTETGAFSFVSFETEIPYSTKFSIDVGNLRIENGSLGVFRTGLYKVATIEKLELKLYQYAGKEEDRSSPTGNGTSPIGGLKDFSRDYLIKALRGYSAELKQEGVTDCSLFMDYSNLTQLTVRDFSYELYSDGKLALRVECRRASVEHKAFRVSLRGAVEITTGEGTILMSNAITWDVEQDGFTVPGRYVLNRNGQQVFGKGLNCDLQLNNLAAKQFVRRDVS